MMVQLVTNQRPLVCCVTRPQQYTMGVMVYFFKWAIPGLFFVFGHFKRIIQFLQQM